jgi:hypothetical protein
MQTREVIIFPVLSLQCVGKYLIPTSHTLSMFPRIVLGVGVLLGYTLTVGQKVPCV